MIIGITATALTFIALMLSIVAYYLYDRRREAFLLTFARVAFYTASILIFFQAVLLMYGILTHHFEWIYVFSYSSRDLSLFYLISTFWAGQEGTFLLWLALGALYGFWIIRTRKEEEPLVMSFMLMVLAFITIILVRKNPFEYVWQVNPASFPRGVVPPDGAGLNPLLQDPWMVIHPPILFAGYSATMIPFAFAMYALIKRNYDTWVKPVLPFAVFAGLLLGAGIILGGYWSYVTLGWGGFWGWDPVENSSLVPWLFSLALIHGLLIQQRQGGMKKTNILLALLTFVFVLYGSFLTRSGILTDFSVHSFGKSELSGYLIGLVLFFFALSFLAYLFRINEVKYQPVYTDFATRESFINFGILVLVLFGVFIFIGTSWPLISGLFKSKAESFATEYYNYLAGPGAILAALLIALAPVLRWNTSSWDKMRAVLLHGVISLVFGGVIYFLGIRQFIPLLVMVLSLFLILINGQLVVRMLRKKNYAFGGYLVHVGVGLMLMGIVTSTGYDRKEKVMLPQNTPQKVFGYRITYLGQRAAADGKNRVMLDVDGHAEMAKFYWSDYSQAWMVGPSVENKWIQDLYISPIQIIPADQTLPQGQRLTLIKEEKIPYGDYTLYFKGYDMNSHQMGGEDIVLKAIIDVYNKNGKLIGEIRPGLQMHRNRKAVEPVTFVDGKSKVLLKSINVENRSIEIVISDGDAAKGNPMVGKEVLAAEVSVKPFINLLWLGTILMILGFLVALYYRFEHRKN